MKEIIIIIHAKNGDLNVLNWILTYDRSIKDYDNDENSCVQLATIKEHLNIVQRLFDLFGKDTISEENLNRDLCGHLAAKHGHLNIIKWLNEKGVLSPDRNHDGDSYLSLAAKNGHAEIVQWLLENNAPVEEMEQKIDMIRLQAIKLKINQALLTLKSNDYCELKQEFPSDSFESWNEILRLFKKKIDHINSELKQDGSILEDVETIENELSNIRSKIQELLSIKFEIEKNFRKLKKLK